MWNGCAGDRTACSTWPLHVGIAAVAMVIVGHSLSKPLRIVVRMQTHPCSVTRQGICQVLWCRVLERLVYQAHSLVPDSLVYR